MPNAGREAYRQAAAECLDIAHSATDKDARARLIVLAGKFFELANGSQADETVGMLLDEFNNSQMLKK